MFVPEILKLISFSNKKWYFLQSLTLYLYYLFYFTIYL